MVGAAPAAQSLQLVLPLKADLAGLRRTALAITTPGSPRYAEYESIAQLAHRFGASAVARTRVVAYLRRAGAENVKIDATGLFVDATMAAGAAGRLFATPLAQFRSDLGVRFVAPAAAAAAGPAGPAGHLPAGLQGLVTGVVGLDTRPLSSSPAIAHLSRPRSAVAHAASQPSSARPRSGTPLGCAPGVDSDGFTPNQYLTAYGYDPLHLAGIEGQGERVALIEIDGFSYRDIKAFAQCFSLPIPALNAFGVGVKRPLPPGGEATLDLEVLDTAAPSLKSIDVYETKSSAADTLSGLTAPLRAKQKPQVISASLGLCELSLFRSVGNAGISSTEGALQMAAASGITFLASSGDQGSADCTAADGTPLRVKAVNYPASSWWVTGVGGTNIVLDALNHITSQVVWNDAAEQPGSAGGGGSSEIFRRPNYQKGTVATDSRAVPDVSLLADIAPGYAIYCSAPGDCINMSNVTPWQAVGGTSAATPLLAGGLALVDQELRMNHRANLGLANPLLYKTGRSRAAASVFFDVTAIGNDVGPDIGGNARPLGCCSARRGYDKATGWGSVNVSSFSGVALSAQPKIVDVGLSLPRQSPVQARKITATVSCSGPCLMAAYTDVTIGRSKPFEIDSAVFRLRSKARRTVPMRFSAKQLSRLRAALSGHVWVHATVHGVLFDPTVYGVLPDPGSAIRSQTGAKQLTIEG